MCDFCLIIRLIKYGISTSIRNYIVESKTRDIIKYHNCLVKKSVNRYNKNLKKMSKLLKLKIKLRDIILNNMCLHEHFSVEKMEKLESFIEELNENIASYNISFLAYLEELCDEPKSREVICEYNKIVEKQKNNPFIFYKCKKISINEFIHNVNYPNREKS